MLVDRKSGKKWKSKKLQNLRFAYSYERRGKIDRFKRIADCGDVLFFRRYPDGSLRLHKAFFCKHRLCPMCAWRRSRKIFGQITDVMTSIGDSFDFIFLTLTVRNVKGSHLKKQVELLYNSFVKMSRRKRFKDAVRGWCRVFEVTYNWERCEFHPHFHVMIAVDKSYLIGAEYIDQKGFSEMWGK